MGDNELSWGLSDSEVKLLQNLEFLTTVETKERIRKQVGFSKGRFVVLKVQAYRCDATEIPIGDSLYDLFKIQAKNGKYDSAREFLSRLEATT